MTLNSETKVERLVIIQSSVQSQHYKNSCRKESDLILAIGPEAMYEAETNSWKYCCLGEIWSDDQYELNKKKNEKCVNELIIGLNNYSRSRDLSKNLEIGNYYAFQLCVIIGQILNNIFIVNSIIKNLGPENLLCYTKSNPELFLEHRPDPDSILANVLCRILANKKVQFDLISLPEFDSNVTRREKILTFLPSSIRFFLVKFRDCFRFKKIKSAKHNLLLIGAGGDWVKLAKYSSFNNFFTLVPAKKYKTTGTIKPSQEVIDLLESSIKYKNIIPYDMYNLAALIQEDTEVFASLADDIDQMLNKHDAVVTAVLTYPWDNFLAHRAALKNMPVIVWQHGEKGQSDLDITSIYTEIFYATDYFAYAPLVVNQYKSLIGKYRLKNVVAIGSIGKQVEWEGGDTILYATGKWFKTTNPFVSDPDSRLFKAHIKILPLLEKYTDLYKVIFKANNTPKLNNTPYQFKNIKIEYEKSFTECLKTAKLVILDTPATTLIEACSTNIPIFCLGGRSEYTNEFLAAVKQRVVWSETPEDLIINLKNFLDSEVYPADIHNKQLLTLFGSGAVPSQIAESSRNSIINSLNRHCKKKEVNIL